MLSILDGVLSVSDEILVHVTMVKEVEMSVTNDGNKPHNPPKDADIRDTQISELWTQKCCEV